MSGREFQNASQWLTTQIRARARDQTNLKMRTQRPNKSMNPPLPIFRRRIMASRPAKYEDFRTRVFQIATLSHRRHDQLVPPAAAARDLGTVAKLQVLRQADPDFRQSFLVAFDGHAARG